MQKHFDITVVGGGLVGLATARKLLKNYPSLRLAVLDKEPEPALHQSSRNSGVIHSGLYYRPGTSRALYCVKGRRALVSYAKEKNIPHEVCGKIVVANSENELPRLEEIFNNGLKNEVEGISKISQEDIRELEPFCRGIRGIHIPCTGIIDFSRVALEMADEIRSYPGGTFIGQAALTSISNKGAKKMLIAGGAELETDYLINCAGLFSDRIAELDGLETDVRIVPFRGDFYKLKPRIKEKVRNLIYPVPPEAFPFLGIHFTRMINGEVECGPNAVFSFKREGYEKLDFDVKDTWDALSWPGTLKLFKRHYRHGIEEYRRAFSLKRFVKEINKLVPDIRTSDLVPARSGVRAVALDKNGALVDDFKFIHGKRSVHVLNAPSPAATACLAIGEQVSDMIFENA